MKKDKVLLTLRIDKSTKTSAALLAKLKGVSLNEYFNSTIANEINDKARNHAFNCAIVKALQSCGLPREIFDESKLNTLAPYQDILKALQKSLKEDVYSKFHGQLPIEITYTV